MAKYLFDMRGFLRNTWPIQRILVSLVVSGIGLCFTSFWILNVRYITPSQDTLIKFQANLSDTTNANQKNVSIANQSILANQVFVKPNLTEEFWSRNWRDILKLNSAAKDYLNTFQHECEKHDNFDNITEKRGLAKEEVNIPLCPCVPGTLRGQRKPNVTNLMSTTWKIAFSHLDMVHFGGYWKPKDCLARRRVAVIIPSRDRETHLRAFLMHTHPLLQRQLLEYRVFVVEQKWPPIFNKASCMNAGFLEVKKLYQFDCVLFHDVDLLPEDDRFIIHCGDKPIHYGAYLDVWQYNLGYRNLVGGGMLMKNEQFVNINGFSNDFFGWGGEDDDLYFRMGAAGYRVMRPPKEICRHTKLRHYKDIANPVIPRNKRQKHLVIQGLNTVKYNAEDTMLEPLFTWIKIKLKSTPAMAQPTESHRYFKVRGGCYETPEETVLKKQSLSFVTCHYICDLNPNCTAFLYYDNQDDHCVLLNTMCSVKYDESGVLLNIKSQDVGSISNSDLLNFD